MNVTNSTLRTPDWILMNAREYCEKYSHDFLDLESCEYFHKSATFNAIFYPVLGVGMVGVVALCCQHRRQMRERYHQQHDFLFEQKSPPTLSERFFEALKTRIPEHTHELSDRNPFKNMAKLFNGVRSAQAVWRRIRG